MKTYRSLRAVQSALQANDISCTSLIQSYIQRIQKQQDLNVFLEVYEEEALTFAKDVDDKLKKGTAGRLAGMVLGIKTIFAIKDIAFLPPQKFWMVLKVCLALQ